MRRIKDVKQPAGRAAADAVVAGQGQNGKDHHPLVVAPQQQGNGTAALQSGQQIDAQGKEDVCAELDLPPGAEGIQQQPQQQERNPAFAGIGRGQNGAEQQRADRTGQQPGRQQREDKRSGGQRKACGPLPLLQQRKPPQYQQQQKEGGADTVLGGDAIGAEAGSVFSS